MPAKLTSLKVQVGSKTLEFTMDEAKELQKVLNELFNTPTVITIKEKEYYPIQPYNPIWIGDSSKITFGDGTIQCSIGKDSRCENL